MCAIALFQLVTPPPPSPDILTDTSFLLGHRVRHPRDEDHPKGGGAEGVPDF